MNRLQSFIAKASILSLVVGLVSFVSPASAATFTTQSDTMTRLKISTTADHSIVFTLPSTITFDSSTNTDFIRYDFPATFSESGTWVTGDFTFNDGTARTIDEVDQGAGIVDCTVASGVNNVCIAVDTTAHIFSVKPSDTYTASAAAATVTFTIDGTATDGTLTNPGTAGSVVLATAMCDETAACDSAFTTVHSGSIALGIVDDDSVTISATVDPSLTFDLDAGSTAGANTGAPYSVALGTVTTTDGRVTGSTDGVNFIGVDIDTNASQGAVITVVSLNGVNGLASTSVPGDKIPSATATMSNGTANYGICIISTAQTTGTLASVSPFASTCAANSETNHVGGLTTSAQNILNTSSAPIAAGRAEIAVNAAISGVTPAHSDYTDTLTFIATGTF